MTSPIRRLAFVVNEQKPGACALAEDLDAVARAHGVATRVSLAFPTPVDHFLDVSEDEEDAAT